MTRSVDGRPERLTGVDADVLIGPLRKELGDLKQVAKKSVGTFSKKGAVLCTQ